MRRSTTTCQNLSLRRLLFIFDVIAILIILIIIIVFIAIIITKSFAALWTADLDLIVGPKFLNNGATPAWARASGRSPAEPSPAPNFSIAPRDLPSKWSGQDTARAGAFWGVLNVLLRASVTQLGLDDYEERNLRHISIIYRS